MIVAQQFVRFGIVSPDLVPEGRQAGLRSRSERKAGLRSTSVPGGGNQIDNTKLTPLMPGLTFGSTDPSKSMFEILIQAPEIPGTPNRPRSLVSTEHGHVAEDVVARTAMVVDATTAGGNLS